MPPTTLPTVKLITPISQTGKMRLEQMFLPSSDMMPISPAQSTRVIPPGNDRISARYHTVLTYSCFAKPLGHGYTPYTYMSMTHFTTANHLYQRPNMLTLRGTPLRIFYQWRHMQI